MNAGYELTPEAEENVHRILLYVEDEFGAAVADRVYEDLFRAFRLLAERPHIGRHRPEFWPEPYLFWPVGPSLIAYRGDVQPIQIVAVDRAERDWPRMQLPRER